MDKIISSNPAKDYNVIGEVETSSDKEIEEKVKLANNAKLKWKELGLKKRIEIIKPIGEEFKKRADEIAKLITQEIGKPIKETIHETNYFLDEFEWFIKNAESAIAEKITHQDENSIHKIVYEPYGTVAVITPWNYPFGMAIGGIIPNLIVGNAVVFKISEECPLVGKLIEEIINSHNLPIGVFSALYGDGKVGKKLAESDINLIWFTGSTKVGKFLYKLAAEKFIRVILELGGSNPGIVFKDVNIPEVIPTIYSGRYENCGQVCDAIKRLIVHESIFDEVTSQLKDFIKTKIVGDPNNNESDIGSLVAKRQLILLEEQVKDAIEKGAKVIIGGKSPENLSGAFYEPTILTNISKDMRVWKEEVFGPVLPIVTFKTEEEAIELANDTTYGLGSRVFSNDIEQAERVASRINAGNVEINQANRWLLCNPFGGYKQSGIGREHGKIGFQELCQIKVISKE